MFTAIKLFLTTDLGKSLLFGAAIFIALGAAYSFGSAHGYANGHAKGIKEGYVSRQQEVDHLKDNVAVLTKTINDERKAVSDKIKQVEADATAKAIATQGRLHQQINERDKIIRDYERTVPVQVQQSCGLSVETVQAINQLIDKANGGSDEGDKRDGGRAGLSIDSTADDGMQQSPEERRAVGGRSVGAEGGEGQRTPSDAGTVSQTSALGSPAI